MNLAQAKEQYLNDYKDRIGLASRAGRKITSYNSLSAELDKALEPLDTRLGIDKLDKVQVQKLTRHWMREAGKKNGISERTAWNKIAAFKSMLGFLDDKDDGFVMPKGTKKLFAECRPTKSAAVPEIDYDALKAVLGVSSRVRVYGLLALNCGAYQCDISDYADSNRQGDYLVWSRGKTSHQSNLVLHHYLWNETRSLLDNNKRWNPGNLLLCNDHLESLVHHQVGKRSTDAIGLTWNRACKQMGVRIPFKNLRKYGATAIARIASLDVQRMYRGETLPGSAGAYVAQDFYGKLTPALKDWEGELQAAGVLG